MDWRVETAQFCLHQDAALGAAVLRGISEAASASRKELIVRYALLAIIPLAAGTWFVDHRAAALLVLMAILVFFVGVVFASGNQRPNR